jgi:nicotinate-nucleotide--dimethylbenzimidazole phosphoribosyltransferase
MKSLIAHFRLSREIVAEVIADISAPSDLWLARARAHLDILTKPIGSLGQLEDIAAQMVAIRREHFAEPLKKAVYVFAADHGVTAEGVSAYPPEVTYQMVLNFLSGGAAINVLARLHHVEMNVIDVGVNADFDTLVGLRHCKVRRGTRNMLQEAAMNDEELAEALKIGFTLADAAKDKGQGLLAIGEMGIGNTTAASAITSILSGEPVAAVTGRGTGLDTTAHAHKCHVIEATLLNHFAARDENNLPDPLEVLRCMGGLEIASMTGMMLGAAKNGIAVVVDGFISTAAAAIAFKIEPRVREYFFAGHQSMEPGHKILLDLLGLHPILSLNMRLGEGTGAVLAMPVIESAMCLYNEMATFTSAGVSGAAE